METSQKPSGYGEFETADKNNDKFRDAKPLPPTHNRGTRTYQNLRNVVERNDDVENSATDFGVKNFFDVVKSLDANRYATKKTIAQGMLDIALLTANASQLKYILQVGKQHEFYTLMLTLISISIGLQIVSGLLSLSLNLMRDRRMDDDKYAFSIDWIGRVRVAMSFIVFLDNIMIAAFDPTGLSSLLAYDGPESPLIP